MILQPTIPTTAASAISYNFTVVCSHDDADAYDRQALEASVALYETAIARIQRFLETYGLTEAFEAFEREH